MKPVYINLTKELKIFFIVFIGCNILNVFSILYYKTQWVEMYTQLGFVFKLSVLLYFVIAGIRSFLYLVKKRK